MTRSIETHIIDWRGIRIEISYEECWLGSHSPFSTAHLQLSSVAPAKAPLPMTETGYRSHFIAAEAVAEAGGPVAYVLAWLEYEGSKKVWKEKEAAARQLTLF
mgnify:CR=1 FL=1